MTARTADDTQAFMTTVRQKDGLRTTVLVTFAIAATLMLLRWAVFGGDYVGADNDDTMRLIEVRDLIAGQGWFDTTQYRLGLEGGTLMHWSRLIDLPIANLIALFSHFLPAETAEAAALTIWPFALLLALLYAMALAARRLGDSHTVFAAVVLTAIFAVSISRFSPGAIDHHNAQLVLLALAVAGLVEPRLSSRSFLVAGIATALAIAIGAETVPIMGVVCAAVAVCWLVRGVAFEPAAQAFSIGLASTLAAVYVLTIPPSRYDVVVCDAYSTGFYALGTIGAGVLFVLATTLSTRSLAARTMGLAAGAIVIGAAVLLIAPQCLKSPLADLDPMLRSMWLDNVAEAQSALAVLRDGPELFASQYLLPLGAVALALQAARRGANVQANLLLAALILAAYLISLVQVRGAVFANLLAVVVFAQVVGKARARLRARPNRMKEAAAFCLSLVFATQMTWALGGVAIAKGLAQAGISAQKFQKSHVRAEPEVACRAERQMAALAGQPTGLVAAVSNIGDDILRHTDHRVLSAPYHRNQGGMLTELHIATEGADTARAFLEGAGVTLVVFCPADPEARQIVRRAPDGLYADLEAGKVPPYLDRVYGGPDAPMQVFRVR